MAIQESASTERTTRLKFDVRDRDCFFIDASSRLGCRIELEEMIQRSDGRLLEFFSIEGAPPSRVRSISEASRAVDSVRSLRADDDGGLFEFVVSGPCVAASLADTGALAQTVTAVDGRGHVVADVPPHVAVRTVVEAFSENHPESELRSQRECERSSPVVTEREFRETLFEVLTERQAEILETAHARGYFDWPRESSATDCAEILDVSQPTFTQHLRTSERKLVDIVFGDPPSNGNAE